MRKPQTQNHRRGEDLLRIYCVFLTGAISMLDLVSPQKKSYAVCHSFSVQAACLEVVQGSAPMKNHIRAVGYPAALSAPLFYRAGVHCSLRFLFRRVFGNGHNCMRSPPEAKGPSSQTMFCARPKKLVSRTAPQFIGGRPTHPSRLPPR